MITSQFSPWFSHSHMVQALGTGAGLLSLSSLAWNGKPLMAGLAVPAESEGAAMPPAADAASDECTAGAASQSFPMRGAKGGNSVAQSTVVLL